MRLEFLILALSVTIAPAAALFGAGASGHGPWVIVVPPWRSAADVALRAGGRLIGPAQAPLGDLVAAEAPDAVARLAAAGAWVVVDAENLADLCGEN